MALDHYIPQVHLQNFYDPALGRRMHAYRKTDLATYPCNSESQCRTDDGSTNAYLAEPRAVEEFLKTIENRYNASVEAFRAGRPTQEAIYALAGFIAYVMTCSPAAMRINIAPIRGSVEMMAAMLERRGDIPEPPQVLGGGTLTDMIADGRVVATIDPKYPQAIGISGILERVATLGNFRWEVLLNHTMDAPFFTSDYPVANEKTADPRLLNRIVPLTPQVAVRLHTHFDAKGKGLDFPEFRCKVTTPSRSEVLDINRELVRSAETVVYSCLSAPWVAKFVAKNRDYRVETWNTQMDYGEGILQLSQQGTRRMTQAANDLAEVANAAS